jgi:hypothetical protein
MCVTPAPWPSQADFVKRRIDERKRAQVADTAAAVVGTHMRHGATQADAWPGARNATAKRRVTYLPR